MADEPQRSSTKFGRVRLIHTASDVIPFVYASTFSSSFSLLFYCAGLMGEII